MKSLREYILDLLLAAHKIIQNPAQEFALLRGKYCPAVEQLDNDFLFRKILDTLAFTQKNQLCFEELVVLTDVAWALLNEYHDEEKFQFVKSEILKLEKSFCMSDEEFATHYNLVYKKNDNKRNRKDREYWHLRWFELFGDQMDRFSAHMQYEMAIVCGMARQKMASVIDALSFEDKEESLFALGSNYGSIGDAIHAIEYYKQAFHDAQTVGDNTYEYIAISRILIITLMPSHLGFSCNLDSARADAMRCLFVLADKMHTSVYGLGEVLMAREANIKPAKRRKHRTNRFKEAFLLNAMMVSLTHGDFKTAVKYAELAKAAVREAYETEREYSPIDEILIMYVQRYMSVDREDAVEMDVEDKAEDNNDIDTLETFHYEFLDGIFTNEKISALQRLICQELAYNHVNLAGCLCSQMEEIASEAYSDYAMAVALWMRGIVCGKKGQTADAINYYNKVIERTAAPSNSAPMLVLHHQALFERGKQEMLCCPQDAIETFTLAMDNMKQYTELNAGIILSRAEAYAAAGNSRLCDQDCLRAIEIMVSDIKARIPYVEGDMRNTLWNDVRNTIEQVLRVSSVECSQELSVALYDVILCTKGFLLYSENAIKNAICAEPSLSNLKPLYEKVQAYNDNKRKWGTSTEDSAEEYVEHYADEMRLLLGTSEVIGKYFDFLNVSYEDIQKVMLDTSVVVDYFDYDNGKGDREYLAFVFRKGDECPKIIKLCRESDLQKVYDEMADAFGDDTHTSMLYASQLPFGFDIRDLLWTKIQKECSIKETENVYFVPSGSIHKIALESLPVDALFRGCTLAETFRGFYRLSNARQIMVADDMELKNVTLFGGLEYGKNEGLKYDDRGYAVYDRKSTPTELHPWGKLPMTAREVNQIAFLYNSWKEGSARKLTGEHGTSEEFISLSHAAPSILHLATHGFFETSKTARNLPALKDKFRPMDLSGIVLSNGNHGWLNDGDCHEGIITASDISRMDLSTTKLVVLSACYTGEGIVRSDGVFGLQRGFKKAGVKSIIMSLWNESDEVGCRFMCEFYARLLSNGNNIRQAFNDAKKELQERYDNPLFWAGFILID